MWPVFQFQIGWDKLKEHVFGPNSVGVPTNKKSIDEAQSSSYAGINILETLNSRPICRRESKKLSNLY